MAIQARRRSTKEASDKKKMPTPRFSVSSQNLQTTVSKTVKITVSSFKLTSRKRCGETTLIKTLEDKKSSKISWANGFDSRSLSFLAHDDALHVLAGCNSLYRVFNKKEYEAFRKWADKFFSIT